MPSPDPRCSRPMPATWPWHGRRASPPSVSGPAPQTLGPPPIKPRDRRPKTLATLASLFHSAAAAPEREREKEVEVKSRAGRRTTPPGAARGEGRRRPELHRAGAPIVFTNAAVLPARLRPTGFDPPPHQALPPSAPPVRIAAAVPSFPLCCRREA
jgi:hypothetical protein